MYCVYLCIIVHVYIHVFHNRFVSYVFDIDIFNCIHTYACYVCTYVYVHWELLSCQRHMKPTLPTRCHYNIIHVLPRSIISTKE